MRRRPQRIFGRQLPGSQVLRWHHRPSRLRRFAPQWRHLRKRSPMRYGFLRRRRVLHIDVHRIVQIMQCRRFSRNVCQCSRQSRGRGDLFRDKLMQWRRPMFARQRPTVHARRAMREQQLHGNAPHVPMIYGNNRAASGTIAESPS